MDRHRWRTPLRVRSVTSRAWRSGAGPGTVIILEGESMEAIRERMNILPFVAEGLMTLEYEEVYEIGAADAAQERARVTGGL
jgi:hypothetical protein